MQERIDILIGKNLSGNATETEQQELQDWIKKDAANEIIFREAQRVWEVSAGLKKDEDADVESAWEEFKHLASVPAQKQNIVWFQPLKIAAALALFISSYLLVKFYILDNNGTMPGTSKAVLKPQPAARPATTVNITADTFNNGDVKKVAPAKRLAQKTKMLTATTGDSAMLVLLPDQSQVYLNAHSKLTYPEKFAANERKVVLEGEAYFEVVHDEKNPFQVYCQKTISRVLGTSFNVKSYGVNNDVEVTVLTGLVEVTGINEKWTNSKVLLAAGDSGLFSGEKSTLTKSKTGKKEKWWKKGNLMNMIKQFFSKKKSKNN